MKCILGTKISQKIHSFTNKRIISQPILGNKFGLKLAEPLESDAANFSKPVEKIQHTTHEILQKTIGDEFELHRDWLDLGSFYAMQKFFSKKHPHYIYQKKHSSPILQNNLVGHISCHYDGKNRLKNFYIYDKETKSVKMFDKEGVLIKQFTSRETESMLQYKSNSIYIHKALRGGNDFGNNQIVRFIKNLSNLFENGKAWLTEKDIVAYRSLDKAALASILSMPKDGMIFTAPSFTSVSTQKLKAYMFVNLKNLTHLMEVKIPKGTPYLKLDDVCHIITPQRSENELLLQKGSKFLIKSRNGKIIAEYLGT